MSQPVPVEGRCKQTESSRSEGAHPLACINNHKATSDSPATSIKPPTRCRLPVTRTSTGLPLLASSRTIPTACSMDGRTCTFSFGKVGTNDVHASASSSCVFRSSLEIETAVRSEGNGKCQWHKSPWASVTKIPSYLL
jgi:hypothetical protein